MPKILGAEAEVLRLPVPGQSLGADNKIQLEDFTMQV